MTEREKIIKVIDEWASKAVTTNKFDGASVYNPYNAAGLADALIAAGYGDMSKQRLLVGKDGTVKQLYSGEEVEKIVKERDECKHRAERALKIVCRMQKNLNILVDGKPWTKEEIYNRYIEQAEKEIAEEERK